jgi:hypothetical protein
MYFFIKMIDLFDLDPCVESMIKIIEVIGIVKCIILHGKFLKMV